MRLVVLTTLALTALASAARAEAFDPAGWKLLGKRTIASKTDGEIALRNYDGNLDELYVVADAGRLRIDGVTVDRRNLKDHSEARDVTLGALRIDLTDNQDTLEHVKLGVTDVDGAAVVRVYGRDRRAPFQPIETDDEVLILEEWVSLARVSLDGSVRGRIMLPGDGAWPALAFASASDLDVLAVNVHTTDGDWVPYLTMKFRDGERVAMVDLPGTRTVTSIDFEYTIIGASAADLEVFGMPEALRIGEETSSERLATASTGDVWYAQTVSADEPEVVHTLTRPRRLAPRDDDDTWSLLGEDEVDLVDDEIIVGKKKRKATYSQIKVVVVGDAVKLRTLDLHLGGKKAKPQRESLEQTYGDGDDSVVIDIPGKRRVIQKIRLTYQKHRLDAETRVQIYAR